jgi:secondary thiamine-phosphate synthase enzyme
MNLLTVDRGAAWAVFTDVVTLRTEGPREIVDVTELVAERVRRSGVLHGIVSVQSHHTTTALVLNEHEPLLLGDLDRLLDRCAPPDLRYDHDDFARRPDVAADERKNGAAHCACVLLGALLTMNVIDGGPQLGRWQRVLLLERDGPQPRTLSIVVMGLRGRHE